MSGGKVVGGILVGFGTVRGMICMVKSSDALLVWMHRLSYGLDIMSGRFCWIPRNVIGWPW